MAQVVPAVARFELRYTTPENTAENVYYVRTSEAVWSEASLDDVSAAFLAWEVGTASDLRGDAVALYEIVGTDLTNLFGLRKTYPVSPPVAGTLAATLPLNATWAVKASIGRRGRGTSGRTFWIGLSGGQIGSDGEIAPISGAAIIAALNTLRNNIADVVPIECMCVPHFVVGGARPPSVQADCITTFLASDFFVDSQRDRLPFHKKHKRYPVA